MARSEWSANEIELPREEEEINGDQYHHERELRSGAEDLTDHTEGLPGSSQERVKDTHRIVLEL